MASASWIMPGEWAPHAGVWIGWPVRSDNWQCEARPAQGAFARVIAGLVQAGERVMVLAGPDEAVRRQARATIDSAIGEAFGGDGEAAIAAASAAVELLDMVTDDTWLRDTGPSCVVNDAGEVRGVNWLFNGWGGAEHGCLWPCENDIALAPLLCAAAGIEVVDRSHFVLEGGSIHVDGEGTLLTTEECLLHCSRNPHLSKQQIEEVLKETLGVSTIIWLDRGLYNDNDTNGHIDNICCFVKPGEVLLAWTDDENDPQYAISLDAYERLSKAVDAKGRKLVVHKIHQPTPLFRTSSEAAALGLPAGTTERLANERLAASYVNFFIGNQGVVVPGFGDAVYDEAARETLQRVFPDKKVIQVYSREIVLGGGNIHCITQQLPKSTAL